jgi:hypothetical protein
MAWDGVERRKYKRYGVKSSTVRYSSGGLLSMLANLGQKYLILNISEGGLKFITKEPLNSDDKLRLHIEAPTIVKASVKIKGHVVWVKRSSTQDVWHVGVAFDSIKRKYEGVFKTLIDSALMEKVDISTSMYLREIKRL